MILSAPGRFSPKAGSAADSRGIEGFLTHPPPPRVGSPPSIVADGGGGLGDQAVTGVGVTVFRLVCWKKTLRSLLATARPGTLSACCLTAA